MELLGLALAALVGLSLGLLGGGGSILMVPILVYVLGFDAKTAIAMSLPIVGATSLVAGLRHWRSGNVQPRTAVLFGLAAMGGAYGGARLAAHLSGAAQLTILGAVMLAAAASMLRGAVRQPDTPVPPRPAALFLTAVGVGMLTGVVGIGGGFLIVPALVLLAGVPIKEAVGTSLLVIALNSVSGFAGYLDQVALPWGAMSGFTAAAVLGTFPGTALVRVVSPGQLRRAFAVFLVGVALFTLYQNRAVFAGLPSGPEAALSD